MKPTPIIMMSKYGDHMYHLNSGYYNEYKMSSYNIVVYSLMLYVCQLLDIWSMT